jgi:hypothetical protein
MGRKRVDDQLESTLQLKRLVAMEYNPYLLKDIKTIRARHGLDNMSPDEAWEYYEREMRRHHHRSSLDYWEKFRSKKDGKIHARTMEHFLDYNIEIEKDIALLLSKYSLPNVAFITIFESVLSGQPASIHPRGFQPTFNWPKPGMWKYLDTYRTTLSINNVRPWISKKDWLNLWNEEIGPFIKEWSKWLGLNRYSRKMNLNSLVQQMKRNYEWYELSEIQGLGPERALVKWEEDNPDKINPDKPIDLSTVLKAIKEFRKIITPVVIDMNI